MTPHAHSDDLPVWCVVSQIARQSSTMSDASSPRRRSHDFGAGLIQRANKNVTSKNTVSM